MDELRTALILVALLAGALEYAMLLRHREAGRAANREREAAADAGLQGLVRVFLADKRTTVGAYRPE